MRDSVGIPEGTVISPETKCDCTWMMLLSNPPKYKLVKKCQKCKDKEIVTVKGGAPMLQNSGLWEKR